MSLNQICGNTNDIPAHIDLRVNNVFITDNLNIQMEGADPGDQIIVQPGGAISWEPADDVANEALEHFQTKFNQLLLLTNTDFTQLGIRSPATIPDPLFNIAVADDIISISSDLKSVFILSVKYAVNVLNEGSCYEFKLQRKFSDDPETGTWADYQDLGRISSCVINHDIYSEQTLACLCPIDSYGGDGQNTYLRFLYKKTGVTTVDATFVNNATNITLIRLV